MGSDRALLLGDYPTPVEHLGNLSAPGADLWVKRDDLTAKGYGGNKVRKLERLLGELLAGGRPARRVVTVGAAGSHHVLATTYYGTRAGLEVEAVLVPQPRTNHVVEVLRACLALGLRPFPVRTWAAVPFAVARRVTSGARFVPLGGSSVTGSMGYVAAAGELAAQVTAGVLPEPDVCVVALGSGGTAAGLAAGFAVHGLATRVVGVCVSTPAALLELRARGLALACARRVALSEPRRALRGRLRGDARFLGRGYGFASDATDEATKLASRAGLVLDPTYTAKAFASALWHVRARRGRHVLYWHTLSSAPIEPLLVDAPLEASLPPRLLELTRA